MIDKNLHGWKLLSLRETRSAKTTLVMPGLLCGAESWMPFLRDERFADRNVYVALPPGYGGNPAPADFDYSFDNLASQLERLSEQLGVDMLIGHSLTANLLVEIIHRQRFRGKVVLVAPSMRALSEPFDARLWYYLSRIPLISTLTQWGVFRNIKSVVKPHLVGIESSLQEPVLEECKSWKPKSTVKLLEAFFAQLKKHGSLVHILTDSVTPVLYLRGKRDPVALLDGERSALHKSEVRLVEFPQSRHFPMLDNVEETISLLLSY